MPLAITIDQLPPVARDVAALIGLPATLRLIDKHGGLRVFVPMAPPPGHPLAELLGMAAADKLARAYGGGDIEVPRVPLRRHAVLIAAFEAGRSYSQLAREHNMTLRNVKLILARHGVSADDRQPQLF